MNKGKERVQKKKHRPPLTSESQHLLTQSTIYGMALHDNMIKGYPKFPLRKFYTSFLSKVTKNQEIKQGKIRENITKKGKKKKG